MARTGFTPCSPGTGTAPCVVSRRGGPSPGSRITLCHWTPQGRESSPGGRLGHRRGHWWAAVRTNGATAVAQTVTQQVEADHHEGDGAQETASSAVHPRDGPGRRRASRPSSASALHAESEKRQQSEQQTQRRRDRHHRRLRERDAGAVQDARTDVASELVEAEDVRLGLDLRAAAPAPGRMDRGARRTAPTAPSSSASPTTRPPALSADHSYRNARIEHAVEQVGEQVHGDVDQRDPEDAALDHRVVAPS